MAPVSIFSVLVERASLSYTIFIAFVNKNNDLCKTKPQSQFMVGFGYIFKRSEIHAKTTELYKKVAAFKKPGCEIKGGMHEMAAMMLMIINFINAQSHW